MFFTHTHIYRERRRVGRGGKTILRFWASWIIKCCNWVHYNEILQKNKPENKEIRNHRMVNTRIGIMIWDSRESTDARSSTSPNAVPSKYRKDIFGTQWQTCQSWNELLSSRFWCIADAMILIWPADYAPNNWFQTNSSAYNPYVSVQN